MKGEQGGKIKALHFVLRVYPPPMPDIFADKLGREKTLTENGGA